LKYFSHQGKKAQKNRYELKTLTKREETLAEKLWTQHIEFIKNSTK